MGNIDKTEHKEKAKLSKLAIISFVLGLVGLVIWLPVTLAVRPNPLILLELLATSLFLLPQTFGVLFAVLALRQMKKSGRLLIGKTFAITGLAVSILAFPIPSLGFANTVKVYCKSHVIRIDDATQGITVELSKENRQEFIELIDIFITGNIDGPATVDAYRKIPVDCSSTLFSSGKVPDCTRPYVIQGKVRLEISEDWYDEVCFLKYEPVDVRSGSLKVRYYLYTLPFVQQTDSSKQKQ